MEINQYKDQGRYSACVAAIAEGIGFYYKMSPERVYLIRDIVKDPDRRDLVIYDEVNAFEPNQRSLYKDTFVERLYFSEIEIIDIHDKDQLEERQKKIAEMQKDAISILGSEDLLKVRVYQTKIIAEGDPRDLEFKINEFMEMSSHRLEGFKVESLNIHEYPRNGKHDPMIRADVYYDRAVVLYSYLDVDPTKD